MKRLFWSVTLSVVFWFIQKCFRTVLFLYDDDYYDNLIMFEVGATSYELHLQTSAVIKASVRKFKPRHHPGKLQFTGGAFCSIRPPVFRLEYAFRKLSASDKCSSLMQYTLPGCVITEHRIQVHI